MNFFLLLLFTKSGNKVTLQSSLVWAGTSSKISPDAMSMMSILPSFNPTIKCRSPGTKVAVKAYPHSTVRKHAKEGLKNIQ